jgi:hypothetical protein
MASKALAGAAERLRALQAPTGITGVVVTTATFAAWQATYNSSPFTPPEGQADSEMYTLYLPIVSALALPVLVLTLTLLFRPAQTNKWTCEDGMDSATTTTTTTTTSTTTTPTSPSSITATIDDDADTESIAFTRQTHIHFFRQHLKLLPEPYKSLDTNRLTLLYFALSAIDVLVHIYNSYSIIFVVVILSHFIIHNFFHSACFLA